MSESDEDITNPDWETATNPEFDAWTWATVFYKRGDETKSVTGYTVVSGQPNSRQPITHTVKCVQKQQTYKIQLDSVFDIVEKPGTGPE